MKRLLVSLMIVAVFHSFALGKGEDRIIRGKAIEEASGTGIVGAVVSCYPSESISTIIDYSITKEDGSFEIKIPADYVTVFIRVTSLSTEDYSDVILADAGFIELKLVTKVHTLDEVRITAPKIKHSGDTLSYNVASFIASSDRSIGDVLRKLPGIDVSESGQIKYQNKEISKFYIEGLDLLQGKYGLATNNIDASKIATIQILENHQPIKILEGMELPDEAAINLKLRQSSKGAFFLNAQVGAGGRPFLTSNELMGMKFNNASQTIALLKTDNTGRDIVREMTSYYGSGSFNLFDCFALDEISVPSIDSQHYLYNNSYVASFNNLSLVKKDFSITSNLNFLYDIQDRSGSFEKTIKFPDFQYVNISEDLSSSYLKRELTGTLTIEKNAPDIYVNNRVDYSLLWNEQENTVRAYDLVNQSLSLPSLGLNNAFSRIKGGHNIYSNIFFSNQNNSLTVSPISVSLFPLDSCIVQDLRFTQIESEIGYKYNSSVSNKLRFIFNTKAYFDRYSLVSDLHPADRITYTVVDSISNNLMRQEYGFDVTSQLLYKHRSFSANLKMPVQLLFLDRYNTRSDCSETSFMILPSAIISLEYKKHEFLIRPEVTYRNQVADVDSDYQGYIMSSYRTFIRNSGILPHSQKLDLDLGLHFNNTSSVIFASLIGGYTIQKNKTIPSISYNGIFCNINEVEYNNISTEKWAEFIFGADISMLNTILNLKASYKSGNYVSLLKDSIVDNNLKNFRISPSFVSSVGKWLSIRYSAMYVFSISGLDISGESMMHNLKQDLMFSFSPVNDLRLDFTLNHYFNSQLLPTPSTFFGNVAIDYKKRKTEFILDWSNVFNTRTIENNYYNDISHYHSTYSLRPSEILLRVRFNIL